MLLFQRRPSYCTAARYMLLISFGGSSGAIFDGPNLTLHFHQIVVDLDRGPGEGVDFWCLYARYECTLICCFTGVATCSQATIPPSLGWNTSAVMITTVKRSQEPCLH
jgi:hypothetical protein